MAGSTIRVDDVRQQLIELEDRGLVRPLTDAPRRTFRFKHALVRDATYGSILATRRALLHRDVAEAILELIPNRDPEMALTVAEHWSKAHDYDQMLGELLPRSEELIFGGHGAAYLQLIEHLAPTDLTNAAQLNEVGRAFYHLSCFARALDFNRASLASAERAGDVLLQAKAASGIGLALWNLSDFAHAEASLRRSRDLSIQVGDESTLANVEFNLSNVLRDRGDYPEAIAAADRALELFIKLGSKTFVAYTQLMLGTCYYSAGDHDLAATYYSLALAATRELGDLRGEAVGLCDLAELEETLGQYEKARKHFEDGEEKAAKIMNDYLLSFMKGGLAKVLMLQGDQEGALKNADSAREIASRIGSNERLGAAYRVLAEIHAARGDKVTALQEARRAIELLEQVGHALELKRANDVYQRALGANANPDSPGLAA